MNWLYRGKRDLNAQRRLKGLLYISHLVNCTYYPLPFFKRHTRAKSAWIKPSNWSHNLCRSQARQNKRAAFQAHPSRFPRFFLANLPATTIRIETRSTTLIKISPVKFQGEPIQPPCQPITIQSFTLKFSVISASFMDLTMLSAGYLFGEPEDQAPPAGRLDRSAPLGKIHSAPLYPASRSCIRAGKRVEAQLDGLFSLYEAAAWSAACFVEAE
ncbi:hypothetical protein GGI43DRAFT_200154 [Trichoderma evansii]